jgi:protein phosphatase PTC7
LSTHYNHAKYLHLHNPVQSSKLRMNYIPNATFSLSMRTFTTRRIKETDVKRQNNNTSKLNPNERSQPKPKTLPQSIFTYVIGSYDICDPKKTDSGSEDAHSLLSVSTAKQSYSSHQPHKKSIHNYESKSYNTSAITTDNSVLAVFDGVGSLSFEKNVNVRAFTQALNDALQNAYRKSLSSGLDNFDPYALLETAYYDVRARHIVGASTACVLSLKNDILSCASVGDSGFILLRPTEKVVKAILQPVVSETNDVDLLVNAEIKENNTNISLSPISLPISLLSPSSTTKAYTIVYRSPQQLHYFNCPAALSVENGETEDTKPKYDNISGAIRLQLQLEEDDIIILATDGLFDNLFEEELVNIVGKAFGPFESNEVTQDVAQQCAEKLAKRSYELSFSKTIDCPFALAAKDTNILWSGGRKDDITVLVCFVKGKSLHT